jgi:hypothetical protein
MTAKLLRFPEPTSKSNGAREALIDLANTLPTTLSRPGDAERWADWILLEMGMSGFKVVPLGASDCNDAC